MDKRVLKANPNLKVKFIVQKNECGVFYDRFITKDAKQVHSSLKETLAAATFIDFSHLDSLFSASSPDLYQVFESNPGLRVEKLARLESAVVEISEYLPVFRRTACAHLGGVRENCFAGLLRHEGLDREIRPVMVINLSNEGQEIGSVYRQEASGRFYAVKRRLLRTRFDLASVGGVDASCRRELRRHLVKGHMVLLYVRFEVVRPMWKAMLEAVCEREPKALFFPERVECEEFARIRGMFREAEKAFEPVGMVVLENQLNADFMDFGNEKIPEHVSMVSDAHRHPKQPLKALFETERADSRQNAVLSQDPEGLASDDLYYMYRYKLLKRSCPIYRLQSRAKRPVNQAQKCEPTRGVLKEIRPQRTFDLTRKSPSKKPRKKRPRKLYSEDNKENVTGLNKPRRPQSNKIQNAFQLKMRPSSLQPLKIDRVALTRPVPNFDTEDSWPVTTDRTPLKAKSRPCERVLTGRR